jgi:hypothetical protein
VGEAFAADLLPRGMKAARSSMQQIGAERVLHRRGPLASWQSIREAFFRDLVLHRAGDAPDVNVENLLEIFLREFTKGATLINAGVIERLFAKHIELGCLDSGAPVGDPRGDDHAPTLEFRKHFLYFNCHVRGVSVIENQKPAGMALLSGPGVTWRTWSPG